MATIIQIIAEHLTKIGADGLVCPEAECGCKLSDLAPCEEHFGACQPGFASAKPDDPDDWSMWLSKEKADAANAAHQATKEQEGK